jgi:hypothetical protein
VEAGPIAKDGPTGVGVSKRIELLEEGVVGLLRAFERFDAWPCGTGGRSGRVAIQPWFVGPTVRAQFPHGGGERCLAGAATW